MPTRHLTKPSEYHDSVTLMETARELTQLPGVVDAAVVMATEANKSILREAGLFLPEIGAATANDLVLFPFVRRALNLAWHRRVRIRHLRLCCDRLVFPPAQMPLFEEERQTCARQENIIAAMDKIRDRFGAQAVRVGRS